MGHSSSYHVGEHDWSDVYVDGSDITSRHEVCEERKVSSERAERMRVELESMDVRLEEEKKRSADLLLQVAFTPAAVLPMVTICKTEPIYGSALLCKLISLTLESLQVNMLQKSLLRQNEEQRRVAALEQQVNQMLQDCNLESANCHTMPFLYCLM